MRCLRCSWPCTLCAAQHHLYIASLCSQHGPVHAALLFCVAAFALISDYVTNSDAGIRSGAILGLGLAYAGTQREEVQELLVPLVS